MKNFEIILFLSSLNNGKDTSEWLFKVVQIINFELGTNQ